MKRISVLIAFTFCLFFAAAQQVKMDSIRRILSGNLSLEERALKMKDLAMYCESVNPDSALRYYNDAFLFAIQNKLTYETAVVLQNKSFAYTALAEYKKAINVLDSALTFLEQSDNKKKYEFRPKIYLLLSTNHRYLNHFGEAVAFQLKAVKDFEELKMYTQIIASYANLADMYKEAGEYDKQMDCADKLMFFSNKTKDSLHFFTAYFHKAYAYVQKADYTKANIYIDSSKKLYQTRYGADFLISYHLVSGLIKMNLNGLDNAYSDFSSGLAIAENVKRTFSIVQSKLQLARILTLKKKFAEAEVILKEQEKEIEKSGEVSQRVVLLDYFARLYEESGKPALALQYFKSFQLVSDSLSSEKNKEFISEQEIKYESDKKSVRIELQQAELKRRSSLNYFLAGSAIALLVIAGLMFRNYQQKKKLQQQRIAELEAEKQLAAAESVLKGEEQERTRLAKDLHDGLGGMLSGIKYSMNTMKGNLIMTPENAQAFERSMDMLDSSIKEMRRVAHNMMPEALVKFGLDTALRDFCNDINLSGALQVSYQSIGLESVQFEQTTAITIYRIVQELVNNTMKHAAAATAIVQVSKTNEEISITVEDDGKGFDPVILQGAKGIGWSNIHGRVEYLKGKLDIRSAPGKGTSVHIEILT